MKTKILIFISSSIKVILFSFTILLLLHLAACTDNKKDKSIKDEVDKNTAFDSVAIVDRK